MLPSRGALGPSLLILLGSHVLIASEVAILQTQLDHCPPLVSSEGLISYTSNAAGCSLQIQTDNKPRVEVLTQKYETDIRKRKIILSGASVHINATWHTYQLMEHSFPPTVMKSPETIIINPGISIGSPSVPQSLFLQFDSGSASSLRWLVVESSLPVEIESDPSTFILEEEQSLRITVAENQLMAGYSNSETSTPANYFQVKLSGGKLLVHEPDWQHEPSDSTGNEKSEKSWDERDDEETDTHIAQELSRRAAALGLGKSGDNDDDDDNPEEPVSSTPPGGCQASAITCLVSDEEASQTLEGSRKRKRKKKKAGAVSATDYIKRIEDSETEDQYKSHTGNAVAVYKMKRSKGAQQISQNQIKKIKAAVIKVNKSKGFHLTDAKWREILALCKLK